MPSPPTDETIKENSTPRISVVVAYEDFDAGKRAQRTCQQILQLAHLEKTLNTDLWKFDMFKLQGMWAAAAEEVAGADLLVVAPQDGADLTDNVREWISASLLHPLRPKALLVLAGPVSTDCERTPPVEPQLERSAAQVKCPYWCLHLDAPTGAWSEPAYAMEKLETVAQALSKQRRDLSTAPST